VRRKLCYNTTQQNIQPKNDLLNINTSAATFSPSEITPSSTTIKKENEVSEKMSVKTYLRDFFLLEI
jgi:hypothetical protein